MFNSSSISQPHILNCACRRCLADDEAEFCDLGEGSAWDPTHCQPDFYPCSGKPIYSPFLLHAIAVDFALLASLAVLLPPSR